MKKLTDLSSREFLTELASSAPVPGGGGVAALAGALAGALASMVANLTIGKEKFAAQEETVRALLSAAEEARVKLLELVESDAAVFAEFMNCYKLPKATDEEKATRAAAVRKAAKQAAEVPLEIARVAMEVLLIADKLVLCGNPGVITDAACSGLLARAALRCAEYNVRINLGLTKDESYNEQITAELISMQQNALAVEEHLLAVTDKAMK